MSGMWRWLGMTALIGLAGCQGVLPECGATPAAEGNWRVAGTEVTPVRGTLSGTLVFSHVGCDAVTGTLDLVIIDAVGGTRRMAGSVTGQVIDGSSLQFTAYLDATPWQHVVTFAGDSASGTWVRTAGSDPGTGTISASRR